MTPKAVPAEERVLERFLEKRAAKQAARDEKGAQYRTYLRWSGKALEIPISVVVGLLLGMYLEKRFGFAPGAWAACLHCAATVRALTGWCACTSAEPTRPGGTQATTTRRRPS
jgi:hypothetical protein